MTEQRSYAQWPLRIHHNRSDWSISFHDPQGKIIHLLNAESQISAYRAAEKLANLYHYDGETLIQSANGSQTINIHKVMNFRNQ